AAEVEEFAAEVPSEGIPDVLGLVPREVIGPFARDANASVERLPVVASEAIKLFHEPSLWSRASPSRALSLRRAGRRHPGPRVDHVVDVRGQTLSSACRASRRSLIFNATSARANSSRFAPKAAG